MTASRTARRTAALLLGASLLAACSGDPQRTASSSDEPAATSAAPGPTASAGPTPSPTPTGSPVPEPTEGGDVPPFPATTGRDTAEAEGGPLTVVAVRSARQDGYDRVVFELAGEQPGQPGWFVEYVDEPRQDGSGNLVELAGDAALQVVITGVGYPFDTGQEEATQDLVPRDTELVREVDLQAVFEGQFQAFVGLDRQAPFRVFRLADPARVVVDVRHG